MFHPVLRYRLRFLSSVGSLRSLVAASNRGLVIGYYWRRRTSKSANAYVLSWSLRQSAGGVYCGCEAAIMV